MSHVEKPHDPSRRRELFPKRPHPAETRLAPAVIRDLQALANQTFDLLVIGGGILGAGIARDAVLRGLTVALVDQADFASGTSSRSTKLIHGGFRYLEQGAFGLVAESCRERAILQRLAPHLVKPLPFLFAVYEGDTRPLWKLRIGMTLYDGLALYRNTVPHRALTPDATLAHEPRLRRAGLRGAVRFYDCQEDDARFCLDNILHAAALGAVCANYCGITGFVRQGDRVLAARTANFEIRARWFINATGPWVDRLTPQIRLSPTKGVHLLLAERLDHGVFWQARDGRLVFVIPWLDCAILGATDTDFTGDPAAARCEPADAEYLLGELARAFPDTAPQVITSFAGIRPLLHSGANPSARSREHRIVRVAANLLTVAGGKYTTYRAIAAEVLDHSRPGKSRTAGTPLPPYRPPPSGEQIAPEPAVFESDIRHARDFEMAQTLSDVMRRRTSLALSRHGGREVAERVAAILFADPEQRRRQVADYLAERERGTL
jgi:glycerol-3-phosphate dehydrogenase